MKGEYAMELRYIQAGASLVLDAVKCIGCGACVEVCPHAVFAMESGKAIVLARGRCMECGACSLNCPAAALSVDSGTGCAAAVLNGMLGGTGECSCDDGKAPGGGKPCC